MEWNHPDYRHLSGLHFRSFAYEMQNLELEFDWDIFYRMELKYHFAYEEVI